MHVKVLKSIALFVLLMVSTDVVQGLDLPTIRTGQNEMLLVEAINQISRDYEVYFTFDHSLVSDIKVDYKKSDGILVEDAISGVLAGTELGFKLYDRRFVILYQNNKEGRESLKKMIKHFEKIIAVGEENNEVEEEAGSSQLVPVPLGIKSPPYQLRGIGITLRGRITDKDGEPLIGATVLVRGTSNGTASDFEGKFELKNIEEDAVLVISYTGYETQEIPVNGQTDLTIAMKDNAEILSQVVVVGYVTKEKGQLTGSVASVDGEKLARIGTADLSKSLQGMVPGLILNDRGGVPGSEDVDILVRGTHTLGNNSPLVVIDGIPRSGLGQLAAQDIEDITVLKDASAAIYGARAANGVIVIRTKRGKEGAFQVQLNSDFGINTLTRSPEMMDSWQWATYQNEVEERYGGLPRYTDEDIEKFRSGDFPITHPNTDFYGETFSDQSFQTHQNLSASGGTDKIRYFISGDYLRQNSQYSSGDGQYDQYQARSNIDAQVSKALKLGVDMNLRLQENKMPSESISSIIHRAYFNFPAEPAFYPNGLPYFTREGGGNPVVLNSYAVGHNNTSNKIVQTKFSFDLDLGSILNGLAISGYGAYDFGIINNETFKKPVTLYKYNEATDNYDPMTGTVPSSGNTSLSNRNENSRSDLYHLRFNYNKEFGGHHVSSFAAYEQSKSSNDFIYAYRKNLFSAGKVGLFAGEEDGRAVDGSASVGGRVNYFGYLAYDYKRKYMVDFSIRRDGSFNFPKDHRFGTFRSVSVGWNIAKESFFSNLNRSVDELKLRLSYGEMGNDLIPAYQYLTKYETGSYLILGESPTYLAGMDIASIPNPNISWEVSKTFNSGIDLILWGGGLSFSFDYFYEKREGILIQRNESVPDYTALELPDENLGRVDNSGVEIVIDHRKSIGDFAYFVGGNFTFNRSKIKFLDEPKDIPEYRKKEGHPINSIVAYEADGIFNDQAELDSYPHLSGAQPGDIKYVDKNGDGAIDDADRVRYYTSSTPEIQFGMQAGFQFKRFSVNMLLQGQTNVTAPLMFNDSGTKPSYLFTDRWTVDNMDAEHPRPFAGFDGYQRLSGYHFNDASFIRLKNLEFSYDLPGISVGDKAAFKACKVYVRGRNLWTISKLKNFDPEVPYTEDYSRGPRAKYYPQLVTYSAGFNITF